MVVVNLGLPLPLPLSFGGRTSTSFTSGVSSVVSAGLVKILVGIVRASVVEASVVVASDVVVVV